MSILVLQVVSLSLLLGKPGIARGVKIQILYKFSDIQSIIIVLRMFHLVVVCSVPAAVCKSGF